MMNDYEDFKFTNEEFHKLLPYKACEFINCTFELIDFSGINLSLSKFIDCTFLKCNLSNLSLKNSTFRDVSFRECKLMGLNWTETQTLSTPNFCKSILDFSVFQSMKLNGAIFSECSLKEIDFYETQLVKANFYKSHLNGTNFSKANLSQADLRSAYDYHIDVKDTTIKKAKFSLPEALDLLRSLDISIE